MLDFAKAFDSLRHDFIFEAFKALGFSDFFLAIIRSITLGGFARVLVNNRITPEFPVDRGVRQGCPLAPLVYDSMFWLLWFLWIMLRWRFKLAGSGKFSLGLLTSLFQSFLRLQMIQLLLLGVIYPLMMLSLHYWIDSMKFQAVELTGIRLSTLLLAMLPFSLALNRFRQLDFIALERLFSVFLWGPRADGASKSTLIAWEKLASSVQLGGSGIWCVRSFQQALMARMVFDGIIMTIPSQQLLSSVAEVLLAQFSRSGRNKQKLIRKAMVVKNPLALKTVRVQVPYRSSLPQKFLVQL
ncbi:hypothetical protein R1sor_025594 [Riccia sorocarpa]|uniref:Reverse transcriptase domain-containing protein n=1 Tax=Riccia sorocarpa TaxID=122646 RepID=A0ABD3GAL0_9MARC